MVGSLNAGSLGGDASMARWAIAGVSASDASSASVGSCWGERSPKGAIAGVSESAVVGSGCSCSFATNRLIAGTSVTVAMAGGATSVSGKGMAGAKASEGVGNDSTVSSMGLRAIAGAASAIVDAGWEKASDS